MSITQIVNGKREACKEGSLYSVGEESLVSLNGYPGSRYSLENILREAFSEMGFPKIEYEQELSSYGDRDPTLEEVIAWGLADMTVRVYWLNAYQPFNPAGYYGNQRYSRANSLRNQQPQEYCFVFIYERGNTKLETDVVISDKSLRTLINSIISFIRQSYQKGDSL